MAAFYTNLANNAQTTELKGKLGLKAGQLEDSVAQEMRFLEFVKGLDLSDPQLWRGKDD